MASTPAAVPRNRHRRGPATARGRTMPRCELETLSPTLHRSRPACARYEQQDVPGPREGMPHLSWQWTTPPERTRWSVGDTTPPPIRDPLRIRSACGPIGSTARRVRDRSLHVPRTPAQRRRDPGQSPYLLLQSANPEGSEQRRKSHLARVPVRLTHRRRGSRYLRSVIADP